MDYIKYTFNDDQWVIYLIDDDDDTISDSDTAAEVMFDKKEMYCRAGDLSELNLRHEVFHIYMGYCYLSDAGLDMRQTEEVACKLYADKGKLMDKKASDIYTKLKQLRDGVQDG